MYFESFCLFIAFRMYFCRFYNQYWVILPIENSIFFSQFIRKNSHLKVTELKKNQKKIHKMFETWGYINVTVFKS